MERRRERPVDLITLPLPYLVPLTLVERINPKQAYTTSTVHALLCNNLTLFFGLGALDPIHWGTSRTNFHRLSAAAISNWQLERDFHTAHGTEHMYMSLIGPWAPSTHFFVEPWMSS